MAASDTTFPTYDGKRLRAHLALPPGSGPHPGVLVIHEVYGLNDDIRRIAQRFAASGYAALAPDLYDRPGARAFCVLRTVAALRAGSGQAFSDLDAARAYFAQRDEVDGERLAVAGFCMGGGFALLVAMQGPYRAAAPYYGDVPEDAKQLEGICPVVAGYGGADRLFAKKGARLVQHLKTLGVEHDVAIYPGVGHSYMSQHPPTLFVRLGAIGPMKAGYDEAAAEDSWKRMLSFFEKHVKIPERPPPP